MNKYHCAGSYSTIDKSNYNRHMNSVRHSGCIHKVEQLNKVALYKNNNKIYQKLNNLSKHIKHYISKQKYDQKHIEKVNKLILENDHYKEINNHYKNEDSHYKRKLEYYKMLLKNTGSMLKSSVSSLTHIINNYSDAPHIKTIKIKDVKNNKDIVTVQKYILTCSLNNSNKAHSAKRLT